MFFLPAWLSRLSESGAAGPPFDVGAGQRGPRFAAMAKLIDEREVTELSFQDGFDARLVRKLRTERRRTYSLYVSELVTEFRYFERQALDRAANDPGVAPGFVEELLRIKMRFTISVWLLRASLWLPAVTRFKAHQRAVDLMRAMRPLISKPSS